MKVTIGSKEYEIKKLSAKEMFDCIESAKIVYETLTLCNDNKELASALAEYGALTCACLYKDTARVFQTPNEALSCLSIDALCDIYDAYVNLNCGEN